MSDESRPNTSSTTDEGITSDLATTSSGNARPDQRVTSNRGLCNCDFGTRKFTSLAYIAFLVICGVVILVAANVNTDEKGVPVHKVQVYRYLTAVLLVAILWMVISIFIQFSSEAFLDSWLSRHIERKEDLLPTHLLVGVMFFGLGSSFLTMVELLEYVAEYGCPSNDVTMLFYHTVQAIFIYTQLYFFYKLSSPSRKVLIFGHFLIMHLIAVNLGTWIVTFVYDSAEELSVEKHHHSAGKWSNVSDSAQNMTNCLKTKEALKSTAEKMEPYLYTFTMEYCLISAGLLLNAWLLLSRSTLKQGDKNENGDPEARTGQSRDNKEYNSHNGYENRHQGKIGYLMGKSKDHKFETKKDHGIENGIKHSNTDISLKSDENREKVNPAATKTEVGTLWRFGFIFGLVYIPCFTAIIFNLLYTDDESQDQLIYIGFQFFSFLSILVASCIGYLQLRQQELHKTHSQVDFILLGVSLVGVFLLDFFIIVASICEAQKHSAIAALLIVTNITELFCSIMFTLFVHEACERKLPADLGDTAVTNSASKIREIVSFLFVLNICFWVMYTFEVKKSNTVLSIVEHFYSANVWFYLSHFVYPLAVFFHFHGAVCMVEILNHYSIRKSRTNPSSSANISMSQPSVNA